MGEFIIDRWQDITFRAYQHASLVLQSVLLALVIALIIAVLVSSHHRATAIANSLSSIGLTLPSLALLGLAIPLFGIGTIPSVVLVVFYAVLPILRNAIVGLQNIDPGIIESARGQGMSPAAVLFKVQLPLAWPVIMTGVRTSLVLLVGAGAFATSIDAGGLGGLITAGINLYRNPVLISGAVLIAALALAIEWVGRVLEISLTPKGMLK